MPRAPGGPASGRLPDPAGGRAIPRLRWSIGLLLGAGVLVNYIDRVSLSVAAPQLRDAIGLTTQQQGWLLSGFFWSYALMQLPVGLVLDRFGITTVNRISTLLWGLASLATAFVSGFGGLLAARIILGIAEAPGFPASSKATGLWFPRRERAFATSLFDAAAKFANVIGVVLVGVTIARFGWRWGFAVTGLLSLCYFAAFTLIYRDPSRHPQLSSAEHAYILEGGATKEGQPAGGEGAMLGRMLRNRKVWGLTIGFSAYGYTFYLFLTWLPDYLVRTMHFSILKSVGVATIPWMCATVADLLVGGWLVDRLIAQGRDETRVRKTVLVLGMLTGLAVFGATLTRDPAWAVLWISIALSGLAAAAPVGWSIPSLIAPRGGTATIGSIMNLGNNLMGAAAPLVTGYAIAWTGGYAASFAIAGVVLLIGILAYVVLLGRLEPIAVD